MTAPVKILSRDLIVQVSDGATTPTFLAIGGFTSATINPSENEETADITTFDSVGNYEQFIAQRGGSLEVEGYLIKNNVTGVQDAGQARVEALGALMGYPSLGQIRFRHPVDTLWKVWSVTVTVAEQGGGMNDPTAWGAMFMRSGAQTTAIV